MIHVCLAHERRRCKCLVAGEPGIGHERHDVTDDRGCDARRHRGIRFGQRARELQEHMIADGWKGIRGTVGAIAPAVMEIDRKSTRLNSSHMSISYAVFCLKKKKK